MQEAKPIKKVLIVISTGFVPYGGLTTVMMNYFRNMEKDDLQIDFASTNDAPDELISELKRNGSEYYNLGERKNVSSYMKRLAQILKDNKYDVIHVNCNSSTGVVELIPAVIEGVPKRITHIHNTTGNHKVINKILHPLFDRMYTIPIACSSKAGQWGYKQKSFTVLSNAVDLKKYSFDSTARDRVRGELAISDRTLVIGNVGKMGSAQKNHPFMIDILKKLVDDGVDCKMLFVGDGEKREEYEEIARKAGVFENTIFAGMRIDVPDFLSAMDVFLFPSLWEGLPLSVIEAAATGLPCIISENVTSEVVATEYMKRLSLNLDITKWCKEILDVNVSTRKNRAIVSQNEISKSGFNINRESEKLRRIYLS